MSVWILDEGILDDSSLQYISSSVRFDGVPSVDSPLQVIP